MDFLGIGVGPLQLLVIFTVAFFVLGPERLPEVARQLARGVKMLRSYATDVQSQFGDELGDIRQEFRDIQQDLVSVQQDLRGGLLELDASLRAAQNDVTSAANAAWEAPVVTEPAAASLPEYRPEAIKPVVAAPYSPESSLPEPDDGRLPDYRPRV
jgi:sec-independent protein translocase protein TatB